MFVLAALVYPVVLAVLCTGAGLLIDRVSGGVLPGMLLPVVGVAALIVVSQLATASPEAAPATPYVLAAAALAGVALGWPRMRALAGAWRAARWPLLVPVAAYVLALAPVLFAGRPTFSSYMSLTDSALHMTGADYLIGHGQDFAHLDLRNSYGELIAAYFNTGYPSGSHTFFGGSAGLLRVPLIWAFQPFNAFVLATMSGPAWVLLRRVGLAGGWAALGALAVTLPALVYGYELVGSMKEIVALPLILALGALVADHARWLRGRVTAAVPFAVVVAAGVSALGVGFGAWVLAAVAVVVTVLVGELVTRRSGVLHALALAAIGGVVAIVGAAPTWLHVSASVSVARGIAATTNAGNLVGPLKLEQITGTWLTASYLRPPLGADLTATHILALITLAAALLGVVQVVRLRAWALGAWILLVLGAWLAITVSSTAWTDAKTLMLTSPVIVLLAWAGVAALRTSRLRLAALLPAVVLAGGVFASDAWQYHSTNLAPTARYDEMASLNTRFAGHGPTLFTDFDEYSQYVLRDLDVSGPDFFFTPPALRRVSPHHGSLVILDRIPPAVLRAFPLIVMRRDPTARRPPSAYRLLWQGTYYQVWGRRPGAPAAIVHLGLAGGRPVACTLVRPLAQQARTHGAHLVAARPAELVTVDVRSAVHPASWTHGGLAVGLSMKQPGQLQSVFTVPHGGRWNLWLQGEIMRSVRVSVDGRGLGSIGGQVGGKKYISNVMTPLRVTLSPGRHRLAIVRGGFTPAPGDGGWAIIDAIHLAPVGAGGQETLAVVAAPHWRSLCGQRLDWIEVTRG